jgi:hypothetical protein
MKNTGSRNLGSERGISKSHKQARSQATAASATTGTGARHVDLARRFNKAGLLSDKGLRAVESAAR